ncbi:MAG: RluA family pseudouridine synthase [Actinomycetes bacterium]
MDELIPATLAGQRIDRVVSMITGVSRAEVSALVADGKVMIDGDVVTSRSRHVVEGQRVEADLADFMANANLAMTGEPDVSVNVVYADDDLLVIDKPPGLVVHPGSGNLDGTLVQGLLARYPEIADVGDPDRPGIVHRLDKGTSGLLLVARSPGAYVALSAQLKAHEVERRYLTLVWGQLDALNGMIDAPIGRSAREPTRMTVSAKGKEARTRYEVIATFSDPVEVSLLECRLETGRTHQIRVHLRAIDHPVVGDVRYGGSKPSFPVDRPWLHAAALRLAHPISGEPLAFDSELPADLRSGLEKLR